MIRLSLRGRAGLVMAVVLSVPATAAAQDDDVEVPAAPAPPPSATPSAPAPAAPAAADDDLAALRRELAELRAKVDRLEQAEAHRPEPAPATTSPMPERGLLERVLGVSAFALSSYVQAQLEWHEDSEDELAQGGEPLNQTQLMVRRGRLRLDAAWEWSALALEIDASTTRGLTVGVRRAEASLLWRGPWGAPPSDLAALRGNGAPPLLALTVGLTEIPFGYELPAPARDRHFMERTTGSLALFPGEPDLGARLWGGAKFFRYSLAVMNGQPLTDIGGASVTDPNAAKDFVGRLGVDVDPLDELRIQGGVSALRGEGFHPGTPATKNDLQWNDIDGDGTVDNGETTGNPGEAATPSENFDRWAVGLDLAFSIRTPIGRTHLYGEATVAQNLDRGLFVADPVLTGIDVRELSAYAAVTQEITEYALVGFRFDLYDPNADFLDSRGGELLPVSQSIRTLSPLVGGVLPGVGKLLVQYDHVTDSLTRDDRGVPTDLANDRVTVRVQVTL